MTLPNSYACSMNMSVQLSVNNLSVNDDSHTFLMFVFCTVFGWVLFTCLCVSLLIQHASLNAFICGVSVHGGPPPPRLLLIKMIIYHLLHYYTHFHYENAWIHNTGGDKVAIFY